MSNLNINQFAQVPVRGQQDLQIARSGIISGAVSANNTTTPINAGDFVDLDPANTLVGQPQFISAAYTDVNFGNMIFDPKAGEVFTPNTIQSSGSSPAARSTRVSSSSSTTARLTTLSFTERLRASCADRHWIRVLRAT